MKYSPMHFARDFPSTKRKQDTIVCQFLIRPVSFLFSSFFAILGFGANAISLISMFFSLGSCALLIIEHYCHNYLFFFLSFACFFVWAILDCADGNIARSIKKEKYGDFFDAIAGYVFPSFYLAAFGLVSTTSTDVLFGTNNHWVFVVSAFASCSMVLLLLSNAKFSLNSKLYDSSSEKKNYSSRGGLLIKRIWSELSFGGFQPFIFLFSYIFNFQALICTIYSALYLFYSFLGMSYLILLGLRANK